MHGGVRPLCALREATPCACRAKGGFFPHLFRRDTPIVRLPAACVVTCLHRFAAVLSCTLSQFPARSMPCFVQRPCAAALRWCRVDTAVVLAWVSVQQSFPAVAGCVVSNLSCSQSWLVLHTQSHLSCAITVRALQCIPVFRCVRVGGCASCLRTCIFPSSRSFFFPMPSAPTIVPTHMFFVLFILALFPNPFLHTFECCAMHTRDRTLL